MRPTIHHTLLCALLPTMALSQSSVGEQAYAVAGERSPAKQASIRTIVLDAPPPPANDALNGADARKGGFTYGVPRPLALDFMAEATWSTGPTGEGVIGQLAVQSPGAQTMSLLFSTVELVGNAQLIVRDNAGTHVLDPYTVGTKLGKGGALHTAVVPGDQVMIEFHGTEEDKQASRIQLNNVNHGLIDFFQRDGGPRGSECFTDVACSLGDGWRDQIRSVAFFLRPEPDDNGQLHGCTGVMLNNTANDFTPYMHIANHCIPEGTDFDNWVFYFNYEKPGCSTGTAPMTQTITGCDLLANDYDGDFGLLELHATPPPNYNVFYSGWDRTGDVPEDGVFIGHPHFSSNPIQAEKKISSYVDVTTGMYPGFSKPWWFVDVDQGGLFGGNSGSPMFNEDKRMVGHVADVNGNCENGMTVWAPKVNGNWNGFAGKRLKDWLDPLSTGATVLNGADFEIRLKVKMKLQGAYDSGSGLMRADLTVPTTEPYTVLGYSHMLHGGSETTTAGVLTAAGNAEIVDWVVIELRHPTSPHAVVATRSALLRRDGVVAETDGSTNGILFDDLPAFNFRIAIRHRNHLGTMTNVDYNLLTLTLSGNMLDFSDTAGVALYGTDPTYVAGSTRCLWMGDVVPDGIVKYIGANNDRDAILVKVGGGGTGTMSGYHREDVNLDFVVKYLGADNDKDPILTVVGGATPTATRSAQLP